MDLTGQLCNLPERVVALFNVRLERRSGQSAFLAESRKPFLAVPRFVAVRSAIVSVLREEAGELRLMEIRRRAEERLGEPLDNRRFKDFVNDQSRGRKSLLERTGYGLYRLRDREF
jgi:hypothetical protein